MPSRKNLKGSAQRSRASLYRFLTISSLVITLALSPLVFLASKASSFASFLGYRDFTHDSTNTIREHSLLHVLKQGEALFLDKDVNVIKSKEDDAVNMDPNLLDRSELASQFIEKPLERIMETTSKNIYGQREVPSQIDTASGSALSVEGSALSLSSQPQHDDDTLFRTAVRQLKTEIKGKRLAEVANEDKSAIARLENAVIERTKKIDDRYNILRQGNVQQSDDTLVRIMRDQLILARVYANIAQSRNNLNILRDLRLRIKESQRALGEANSDAELPRSASEKIKSMDQVLSKAREQLYDCTAITKKLRAMLQSVEEQARALKKQSTFLSQLAAKTIPKSLHCLSLRLTVEYNILIQKQREFNHQERLDDTNLYHYALFSDNVIAASVVVNSTMLNAKEPEKHVFHLVTDKLNYAAMKMWFLANPPGNATIEILNINDFKWLNSSYCPVLRQLESTFLKEYYFKADHSASLTAGTSNLKYRNPKYLSMLNHLRFYLPEVFPKLDKILFLDDDVVVQKDLTNLWSIDLNGKVVGVVETCGQSFHRFDKYLNFSNPIISRNFDPNACGWAFGMNIFDLQEWKRRDITGIYHKWQNLNEDRVLWKLGTLPPGLITFYNLTHSLEKSWHVLGLGYNPNVDQDEIANAAVIHYNGNMKPWLELAVVKYRSYWSKYVKYEHLFLQECNVT